MIDLGTHQSLVLRPPKSQPSQKRNERRRKKWCQKYGGISPPGEWLKHEGCTYTMVLPNTEGKFELEFTEVVFGSFLIMESLQYILSNVK